MRRPIWHCFHPLDNGLTLDDLFFSVSADSVPLKPSRLSILFLCLQVLQITLNVNYSFFYYVNNTSRFYSRDSYFGRVRIILSSFGPGFLPPRKQKGTTVEDSEVRKCNFHASLDRKRGVTERQVLWRGPWRSSKVCLTPSHTW